MDVCLCFGFDLKFSHHGNLNHHNSIQIDVYEDDCAVKIGHFSLDNKRRQTISNDASKSLGQGKGNYK